MTRNSRQQERDQKKSIKAKIQRASKMDKRQLRRAKLEGMVKKYVPITMVKDSRPRVGMISKKKRATKRAEFRNENNRVKELGQVGKYE